MLNTQVLACTPACAELPSVIFQANEEPPLPLKPVEEPLDDPAPPVATQPAPVLRFHADTNGPLRRDHLGALSAHFRIELIADVCAVANQILRLRFDHVELEGQLNERYFMVIGGMGRTAGDRP